MCACMHANVDLMLELYIEKCHMPTLQTRIGDNTLYVHHTLCPTVFITLTAVIQYLNKCMFHLRDINKLN